MSPKFGLTSKIAAAGVTLALGVSFALSANSQTAPAAGAAAGPSPGRQAVETRKAIFTLVGASFRPIGAILKGSTPYDAALVDKSIARVVFLSKFADDAFPEVSNLGEPETKAKPEIWTERADFETKLQNFQTHILALQKVNEQDKGPTDAFKTAAAAVGQDCKACHDAFKVK
ncbi:cytochrome c prime [Methylocella silvestris BL2]|uniref:Cytochrome c prime n=1 Tax=Methylocella silvestris (strain DSM 15510 / CIP 108128 / LMG 27833 / NCIMB 13906 / BL2) TaxID=395965 RepID=B8EMB6_METSB|nr:cytochrome c [Methylocella silvestris]ACK52044.1 cytochrome c prime [Methylocella silvestris BL2]